MTVILNKKVAVIAGSVLVAGTLLTGAAFATANIALGAGPTAQRAAVNLDKAVQDGKLTQAEADLLKQMDGLRQTAIDQAVADGKITQEQADKLLKHEEHGRMGRGGFGDRGPKRDGQKPDLDQAVKDGKLTQAEADLLKQIDALRQSSMEKTQADSKALVDQAVTDGKITQEQADKLLNHGGHGGMDHGFKGPRGGKGR